MSYLLSSAANAGEYRLRIAVGLWLMAGALLPLSLRAADPADAEFFEKQVRPILVARCYECHSSQTDKPKGGLRLDSRGAAITGGETGPAIVPSKVKDSLLVDAINYGELYQMPPKSRLPAEEVAVLTKWVEIGAPWPEIKGREPGGSDQVDGQGFDLATRKAEHWCWQPIQMILPPAVIDEGWVHEPLDRFILARLEARGLRPAQPADEQTLVRRAYFDLTGLPPSPEELPAGDRGEWEQRYAALIDRLLASPRFGERWGRHWLDLMRYAESRGHEFDYHAPNAFEYRDYVIRALNADVPYDQFLIEHIAGDMLEHPRLHPAERWNESIIGPGFWFLGEWCHSPVDIRKDECDRVDNMIDVFSKAFLGITLACARCHDHKFDAISQRDYYALAGYLQSSSYRLTRFGAWEQDQAYLTQTTALDRQYIPQIAAAVASELRARTPELARQVAAELTAGTVDLSVPEVDLRGARVIVDYGSPPTGAWMADGPAFGAGPVRTGQFVLTGNDESPLEIATYGAARSDPFWGEPRLAPSSENDAGRLAGWLRAGRTLKTPTFTLDSGFVHYLIEGVGRVHAVIDSHTMNNGPLHAELLKETGGNADLPTRWITHDLSRYTGHRLHLEFSPDEEQYLRVLMVVEGRNRPAAPANRPNRLLGGYPSGSVRLQEVLNETIEQVAGNRIQDAAHAQDRAAIANWLIAQCHLGGESATKAQQCVADLIAARTSLADKLRTDSRLCMAMWEGTPVDEYLLIRGNHKTLGAVVTRALPAALDVSESRDRRTDNRSARVRPGKATVSNRLEIARRLVDPQNPLLSRVIVNRVWQHLMGRGIVPSVDNFGVLGQPPTHPELLDYLAAEFMRDGWSIKRLVRRIMLSSTYRQRSVDNMPLAGEKRKQRTGSGGQGTDSPIASSHPPLTTHLSPAAEIADPENVLFHRQNLKRLEGEAIRDSILAVSGQLDTAMYGPSVPVYLTTFMQGRGRPKESGPLNGAGRRSIYVAVRRNFLSPMMLAFDTPIPFTTMGRRNVSNVPAQALILMNDPFVAEQARSFARRVLALPRATSAERARQLYLAAFSREPSASETSAALEFLGRQARELGLTGESGDFDERVWADLAHVLYSVKEFVLVR